jgi:hypothetical protein
MQSSDNITELNIEQQTVVFINRIKFIFFTCLQLCSLPCFLFVFYNFIVYHRRTLRKSMHDQTIVCLLGVSFVNILVDLPMFQAFLYHSYVVPSNELFCSIWIWVDYTTSVSNLHLMACATVERYVFIFHSTWIQGSRMKRVIVHYGPVLFAILYSAVFYFVVIFFVNCKNVYDYTEVTCHWPCYFQNWPLSIYDFIVNTFIPLLTVPIFSAALFAHILFKKRQMRLQFFKWKRDRKMILQLVAISTLYLFFWLPLQIFNLMNTFYTVYVPQIQSNYINYFALFVHLFSPFICLLCYPEMLKRARKCGRRATHNSVRPAGVPLEMLVHRR